MNRAALKSAAAAATAILGGCGLAACSNSADSVDASVVTGGEWSATIDGTPVEISEAAVLCAEQAGNVSLSIGSASGTADSATGLSAMLGSGDNPEVQAVGMGSTETGDALAYAPGMPGNQATATKNGDTYEITGVLTAVDMNNPMAEPQEKSFELSVTCP